jgi:ABC-type transport system involved in multi-copper enzyme maturation permease subunit
MFRFTVEEAMRRGTLIFYFCVSTIILLLFALYVGRSPANPDISELDAIENTLIWLHSSSVFWIILFGIFGVAGLIPSMLEKGTIDLFLSKPLARTELLMARALGAVAGIALNLFYFFIGIWLIFGLKAGVWHWAFLSSVIYVIYAFICFFSVVTLVGLITRSSGFSILLAFVFSFVSLVLEARERGLYLLWDNVVYRRILDAFYYLTPQLNAMLDNSTRVVGNLLYIFSLFSFCLVFFAPGLLSGNVLKKNVKMYHSAPRDFEHIVTAK